MTSRTRKERIIVKGYMRPDGTSYYVVIPKPIRALLGPRGGEYFVMKAEADDRKIELKLVDFAEDTSKTEGPSETKVITDAKDAPSELNAEERPEKCEPNPLEEHDA